MYSGVNITYECCVSHSILYEVSNAISDDVFKRNCLFNGELMLHSTFKIDAEKVLYVTKLEEKGLIKINENFRTENLCVLFYRQTSYWGAGNINYENNCAHLKYERLI